MEGDLFDRRLPPGLAPDRVEPHRAFIERLIAIVMGLEQNPGSPQAPSDLNQRIMEMGGRDGPPMGPGVSAPQDDFLQYLMETQPLNTGGPPGPETVPPTPPLPPPGPLGYGANEPGARAAGDFQPGSLPQDMVDSPQGFSQSRIPPPTSGGHSPDVRGFLAELLANRPELLAMQTPASPTDNQDAQMKAVAMELMSEELQRQGRPGLESEDRGAEGYPAWAEAKGQREGKPDFAKNAVAKKGRDAQLMIGTLPEQVRELLDPNAAGKIAQNPRGTLTDWAGALLRRGGNADPEDPYGPQRQLRLRTDQANALLGAGPGQSSLLQGLDPQEAAMARQTGGIDSFMAELGALGRNPAARGREALDAIAPGLGGMMDPSEGLPLPGAEPPVGRRGMTAPQIGAANVDPFERLMSQIPTDWNPGMGESGSMPMRSVPGPGPQQPSLGFLDELKKMVTAQATGDESARFPEATTPPYLDRSVAAEVDAPEQGGFGPDMLEQRPGRTLGLDEGNNIRVGSGGGPMISGSLLESLLGKIKSAGRGLGEGAMSAGPNLLDMYQANDFANALTGANEQYGGVMAPDSQGNMNPIPINPGVAAMYSLMPFIFDRRRFADDPQYRRQMLGPENIPEVA